MPSASATMHMEFAVVMDVQPPHVPQVLDEAVVLVGVDLPGLHRAHLVLRVDVQHLASAERAERHVAARHHHRGDVEARRRHQVSGHDGVARGEHHHAVEEVALGGDLHLVGDRVARGDLHVLRVLQHHAVADAGGHHLHGEPARVAHALLHALGERLQVHVAGVVLVPAVDDADERTRLLLGADAHAAQQTAAALARLAEFPFATQVHFRFLTSLRRPVRGASCSCRPRPGRSTFRCRAIPAGT